MNQLTPRGTRRQAMAGLAAAGAVAALPRAAHATPQTMTAAVAAFTRGKIALPGAVALDIPALVENGNSVPVKIGLKRPPAAGVSVKTFALFSEKNPLADICRFHLAAGNSRPEVSTRIRLSDSQKLLAVAEFSDGSFWSGEAELIVTLPACVET